MAVLRWVITDPTDTNPLTNKYTFPRNPVTMSSPYRERSVSSLATVGGKVLLHEGSSPAKQWTFEGPILDKAHHDALYRWVYTKKRRLVLTDHYARHITLVFTNLEITPQRRINVYYSHNYTVTALITAITLPTVPNTGPA